MMSYTALEIAKYIISTCSKKNRPISNLTLQKLLYFAWIYYYSKTGNSLFHDDICAWQFGPVVPDVYYEYCSYAGMPISQNYSTDISEDDKALLDNFIEEYACYSASTLVERTHTLGKPWSMIFRNGIGNRSVIPYSLIVEKECLNAN